jgi:hypothetical protein
MTSFYAIPKPRRWEILGIISKGYDRDLAKRPRADEKDQRADSFRRGLRGRDKWLGLQMKRLINFRRFKSLRLHLHADREEFKAMWQRAGGATGEGIGEKKRFAGDQIRLRTCLLRSVRHRSAPLESSRWYIWFEGVINRLPDPPPPPSLFVQPSAVHTIFCWALGWGWCCPFQFWPSSHGDPQGGSSEGV